MFNKNPNSLTRIGVFYDGNYFLHVSNYYNYTHERRSRISINGLHDFVRQKVAELENSEPRLCQIVDAHYFRGRLTAGEASQRGDLLYYERVFDDILMSEGVTTHYLPVRSSLGKKYEKGIDVWLALEAFEMAFYKRFDVLVLIAADGDYVPLVRKLNTLGTRVMVLGWDFEYTDEDGSRFYTRTSQDLLAEVTYPVAMQDVINGRDEALTNQLFVPRNKGKIFTKQGEVASESTSEVSPDTDLTGDHRKESYILSLKEGFGFIKYPPNNVFFHYTSLRDYDFNDLLIGDRVQFTLDEKEGGRAVGYDVVVLQ
ncbi:NYN domain-containing protein [Runella zeae]|uniref:NYN domain-containing protein n=1 Tax=Runella zeae TaxID=94255 RepID=UPI000407ECF1|nr:NYN domain-containing protein [Runella zeae]